VYLYPVDFVSDNLEQIQVILNQEAEVAKQALKAGDKEKARRALRRRKYQESLLQQTDGQLEQLEQLVRFQPIFKMHSYRRLLFVYFIPRSPLSNSHSSKYP
jgi:Snf7